MASSRRPLANKQILAELRLQEEEFRHDAEGAGLSAEKTRDAKIERVESV